MDSCKLLLSHANSQLRLYSSYREPSTRTSHHSHANVIASLVHTQSENLLSRSK